MTAQDQADAANAQLEKLYGPWLSPWREMRATNPELSIPMFLKATPAYFASGPRLVFVGQETHGWMNPCEVLPGDLTVKYIMDFYQGVRMTDFRIASRSPFWSAVRKMGVSFGQTNFPAQVITANLFPCDVKKTQGPETLLEAMRGWRLLPAELEILAPEVVIFFVGPRYSWNLGRYFGSAFAPSLSKKNLFAPYQAPGQPWKAWVTYHPAYLRRSRQESVLDLMGQSIRQGLGR